MRLVSLLVLSALVSGCATMSKEECKVANWKDVGFNDGSNGEAVLLADHAKSCAETGVTPNQALYMQGYAEGEKSYCTYDNGLRAGEESKYIGELCKKPGLKESFNDGYLKGKKRYAKRQEIKLKEEEISRLDKKVNDIKSGKDKGGVAALDLVYRQKEIVTKEVSLLEQELANIQ
ncbi:MAG: DUF2799 domain-containing protein [Thiolinea sp.]